MLSHLSGSGSGDVQGSDVDVRAVEHLQHLGDHSGSVLVAEGQDVVRLGLHKE